MSSFGQEDLESRVLKKIKVSLLKDQNYFLHDSAKMITLVKIKYLSKEDKNASKMHIKYY